MSIKYNIAANYVSQIYVAAAGIVMVPLYVRYMGAEAYGLVGFFAMLQAWFNLLDFGLSPTIARETARLRGGALDILSYLKLVRALQLIFVGIALLGAGFFLCFSGSIAHEWLKAAVLTTQEVETSIKLMAVSVALRWISGLYRGMISGFEEFVWLGGYNCVVATMRFVGVMPVLIYIGSAPVVFFGYQLFVAIFELLGLVLKSNHILNCAEERKLIGWSIVNLARSVGPVLKFSMGVAFTSAMWVLVTQTDKLVLSKIIQLSDYGYYSLGVMVASGIQMLSGPITNSILPKMTKLYSEGRQEEVVKLYSYATQCVAIVVMPVGMLLAIFPEQLLFIWTGSSIASKNAAFPVSMYALGNVVMTLGSLPILLQYSFGRLRFHVIGNLIFGVGYLPILVLSASRFGVVGACWAWFVFNVVSFLFWLPVVHKSLVPGVHSNWIRKDVCCILFFAMLPMLFFWKYIKFPDDRLLGLFVLVGIGATSFVIASMGSSFVRSWLKARLASRGMCNWS